MPAKPLSKAAANKVAADIAERMAGGSIFLRFLLPILKAVLADILKDYDLIPRESAA